MKNVLVTAKQGSLGSIEQVENSKANLEVLAKQKVVSHAIDKLAFGSIAVWSIFAIVCFLTGGTMIAFVAVFNALFWMCALPMERKHGRLVGKAFVAFEKRTLARFLLNSRYVPQYGVCTQTKGKQVSVELVEYGEPCMSVEKIAKGYDTFYEKQTDAHNLGDGEWFFRYDSHNKKVLQSFVFDAFDSEEAIRKTLDIKQDAEELNLQAREGVLEILKTQKTLQQNIKHVKAIIAA